MTWDYTKSMLRTKIYVHKRMWIKILWIKINVVFQIKGENLLLIAKKLAINFLNKIKYLPGIIHIYKFFTDSRAKHKI